MGHPVITIIAVPAIAQIVFFGEPMRFKTGHFKIHQPANTKTCTAYKLHGSSAQLESKNMPQNVSLSVANSEPYKSRACRFFLQALFVFVFYGVIFVNSVFYIDLKSVLHAV
jgi:hypothetical protein